MVERTRRNRDAVAAGERIAIRPARAQDRDEFVALMRASRELHRPWSFPPTEAAEYDALIARARREDFAMLLAVKCDGGAIAGFFNLSQIFRGPFQNAYLGYAVGAPYARRGYMSEAIELVVRHAFDDLGLHRLEANIQPGNEASIALAKRAGFRLEGFSQRYLKIGGHWRDHERWAVLADDLGGPAT
ncbi:MAG: GNAT family protein [Thermoleophilaceae bacterium]